MEYHKIPGVALLNYDAEKYFKLWNECYGKEA